MLKLKFKGLTLNLWDFFASVKLAIVILIILASTSIIGTIIPQRTEEAMKFLTRIAGDSTAPTVYNIFLRLGFIDMYHSWWFMALLSFLTLNITICSFDRLPGILRIIKDPIRPLSNEQVEKMPVKRSILLKGKPDSVKDTVSIALKKAGFNIKETGEDKGYHLYSQKGRWSRLGVYITHLSILVILLGAIIGMFFSVESFLSLAEGRTSSEAYSFSGKDITKTIPLGFEIRCDNFEVEFYDNSEDTPKSFKSQLAIIEDGKEVLRKTIKVNDPLTYKGTTFYQSDYGMVPGLIRHGTFIFRVTSREGQSTEVQLKPGDVLRIPNTLITGKIINFSPALIHDESGKLTTYSDELKNPAVHIDFSDSGKKLYSHWIFKRYPETSLLPDGNRVEFLDYWGVEYTHLLVRRDPGIWIVYSGLITMGIGLIIAFFFSHKKIRVHLIEEEINTRVLVGATANKNRNAFEKKIDRIINTLGQTQREGE